MATPQHHILPLQTLLIQLEQAGFSLDPSEQIRIQQVMHELGADYLAQPEALRRILSPLIAKTPEEQERFYTLFEDYLEQMRQPIAFIGFEDQVEDRPEDIQARISRLRKWLYPVAIFFLITIIGAWQYIDKHGVSLWQNEEADLQPLVVGGNEQDMPKIDIKSSEEEKQDQSVYPDKYLFNAETALKREVQIAPVIKAEIGRATVLQLAIASHSSDPTDCWGVDLIPVHLKNPTAVQWFSGEKLLGTGESIQPIFEQEGLHEIHVWIRQDGEWKSLDQTAVLVKQNILSPQEVSQQAFQELKMQQNIIKFQVFLLAILLIFGVEGFLYRLRKRWFELPLKREFRERDQGPYEMPFPPADPDLDAEKALLDLAQGMKDPFTGNRQELDISQTLYATVRAGGYPQLQFQNQSQVPEYVILIDEAGPSAMQAGLFEQLMRLLKEEGVVLHLWKFRNDPRSCFLGERDISLDSLASAYGMHRLIVFSKGSGMINPVDMQLADWVETGFGSWDQRILLTPEPAETWSLRERALNTVFRVLPADMATQEGLLEALLEDDHPDFELLQGELLAQNKQQMIVGELETADALQDYLGDALFQWVAATAVVPKPSWEMTVQIGKALQEREQMAYPVATQGNHTLQIGRDPDLLSYGNLLKLTQLPLFQTGEISESLRRQLLQQLDPETEQLAREAVLDLLAQVDVPEDSQAYQQKQIETLVQEKALNPEKKSLQRTLSFLWKNGLLDRQHMAATGEQFRENWWRIVEGNVPWRLVLLFFIPLMTASWVNYKTAQYSNERLFEKHFQPIQIADGSFEKEEWARLYRAGDYKGVIEWYKKQENVQKGINEIESLVVMNAYLMERNWEAHFVPEYRHYRHPNTICQTGEWYAGLDGLLITSNAKGTDGFRDFCNFLIRSAISRDHHIYHQEALALQKDLDSFWRW